MISNRVKHELATGGGGKVWAKIVQLAANPDIIADLGQGYPNLPAPQQVIDQACDAIRGTTKGNQYSPVPGTTALRSSLSCHYSKQYGEHVHPDKHIVVTTSGTEALYASIAATVNPGDRVVIFEPYFPWYLPCVRMAGGIPEMVTLEPPSFGLDVAQLEALFDVPDDNKPSVMIVNTPHNPTGHVFDKREIDQLAKLCVAHNVTCISDEVYEDFVFPSDTTPRAHHSIRSFPGMDQRTITISSASKKLCVTGWRVGWTIANEDLTAAVKAAHGYMSYCAATPLQDGVSGILGEGSEKELHDYLSTLNTTFQQNAQVLAEALASIGAEPFVPEGGYFLVCDVAKLDMTDVQFCEWLATEKKVVCVPLSVFYSKSIPSSLVRFAICKDPKAIQTAAAAIMSSPPK